MATTGIYKISEAARYLYVTTDLPTSHKPSPRHLIRWIREGLGSPSLVNVAGRKLLIDFEDLISMRVIALLHGLGVSTHKIKAAEAYLHRVTSHSHPFATEQLWTESMDIFAQLGPLLVTASRSGQLPFIELVRHNLVNVHDLTFSGGLADSWSPSQGIILRPQVQLGAPCIAGTGIPTYAIWRMFIGGDSVNFIARSYDIAETKVQHAIDWEDRLATVTFPRAA